ncbi:glutamate--tRNA ligase [Coralliovum pocilloporae]|uniref:glutamate--tRNA ligase n=1 Tax=Coralliovum pocilloporae TaxID=3066369 RepID=UPI003307BD3C
MTPVVRFAPSPTGRLHIGNARTALFNWLYAKSNGGQFILRYDDTDRERSTQEFADGIAEDLAWLGIRPDRVERQSARVERYDAVADELRARGLLYPCYETPDELDRKRKRQRARGLPPIYDRAALDLTDEERAAFEADGRRPHWRFKLEGRTVTWTDLVRGEQSIDTASLSDPILIREDGTYLYTLPSVIDDIDMGVSHVVRGEDHVANTGAQIEIFEALGSKPTGFGHHNLLTTASGEGLSKRLGSLSLKGLRDDGFEPGTVASLATLIGTSEAVEPFAALEGLADHFAFSKVSRAPAKFDPDDLKNLNMRLLQTLSYDAVAERLQEMGVSSDAFFWETVRGNIATLQDTALWWQVVTGPVEPEVDGDDRAFISAAREALPAEPWDETTWSAWTKVLKGETGRKGKSLFMPLRKAITGLSHGPELGRLLPLIGRKSTEDRLS